MAYTNKQMHDELQEIRKHVDRGFKKMTEYVDTKIAPLHDYMIGQQAIDAKFRSPQQVNSKDLLAFILKVLTIFAGIIAAVLGVNKLNQ